MILIISYPAEEHTDAVETHLRLAGRELLRLDMAEFPARRGIELEWQAHCPPAYRLDIPDGTVDIGAVRVAWWRRVREYEVAPEVADLTARAFATSETAQAVEGLFDALPCVWVNPRAADTAAHRKPYQWAVAQNVGLTVPRTLVTTKPEAARRFVLEVGTGRTVFKEFIAMHGASRETRTVGPRELEQLDLVRYAPVIFQEYIDGVDLRITAIGEQLFAAEIDARKTSYPADMRMVFGDAQVQPVTLPPALAKKLLALMKRLGLSYGAIDMRRTDAGDYYFFEVNPAGQWLFVEHRTGLPISQGVADFLIGLDANPGELTVRR